MKFPVRADGPLSDCGSGRGGGVGLEAYAVTIKRSG
jgi:hypothetical protein